MNPINLVGGGYRFELKPGSLDQAIANFPFEPDEFILRFSAKGIEPPKKGEHSEKEYMVACAAEGVIPFSLFCLELTSEGFFRPKISSVKTFEKAGTFLCEEEVVRGMLEGKRFYMWEFEGDSNQGINGLEALKERFLEGIAKQGYNLVNGRLAMGRGYKNQVEVQIHNSRTAILKSNVNSTREKVSDIYTWLKRMT